MLVLVFILLVLVGIEITQDLGWLTVEDWVQDIFGLLQVFMAVIIVGVLAGAVLIFIKHYLFKNEVDYTWAQSEEPHDDGELDKVIQQNGDKNASFKKPSDKTTGRKTK